MNAVILSEDYLYSQMLQLELSEMGFKVQMKTALSSADTHFLLIADADTSGKDIIHKVNEFSETVIIFSKKNLYKIFPEALENNKDISKYVFFQRPFSIVLFRKIVRSITEKLKQSHIEIDETEKCVYYRGESTVLTDQEFRLFRLLFLNKGIPVSRENALYTLYNEKDSVKKSNIVDVYIRFLREKLEEAFGIPMIITVRGKGYMISDKL